MKQVFYTIFLLLAFTQLNQAQILTPFPCYSVANNNGAENTLFKFNPATNQWNKVGTTSTNFIDAIAIDGTVGIIYAAEGSGGSNGIDGAFGTIDPVTGAFTTIGTTGTGNGAFGPVNLNNIDGMSFDPVNQIMYAIHRIEGDGPQSNDLLFQIDVSTGSFVPNAMIDDFTGFNTDYSVIPEVFNSDFGADMYDVADIAYNHYTGELYAIHNQDDQVYIARTLSIVDPLSGALEAIAFKDSGNKIEGISFTYLGELFGTTGNSNAPNRSNVLLFIDLVGGQIVPLNSIDATTENIDFKSFDCDGARNDLALKIALDESTTLPVKPGDLLTCQITIYNQGDIDNFDITLTNYIPFGLSLIDANWIATPNGLAIKTITEPLSSGASTTIPITLKVDDMYNGSLITNAAEITSSFNPDITDNFGNPIPLPDVDSVPNDLNDEFNIVDDTINGGGPDANEDEDDHDIVMLNFDNGVANILNLTGLIDEGVYLAGQTIISNGQLKPSSNVLFKAGNEIILHTGFDVESDTFFNAEIGGIE